jgi:3-dehydroquinate synthase
MSESLRARPLSRPPDRPTRITVSGDLPYDVLVGTGLLDELPAVLGDGVHRVAVIHAKALEASATRISEHLKREFLLLEVPDGEQAKDIAVAARCWAVLGRAAFTRSDAIVSLGGGAVTDLAGFVAATWLRGVRVVHVPTTLLGMVDAAVGGKTALNTAEGKNLVGVIHPPAGVLCDLDTLATLPRAEYASGLAEVIKAGFIADPMILDLIEHDPAGAVRPDGRHARELVEAAIRVKAEVVSADLRETAPIRSTGIGREMLNYGHTLGHAIEQVEQYRMRHGEAVAIGMVYAAELARLAGRLPDQLLDRHREILALVGLPTSYGEEAWPDLLKAMKVDKKARGDQLRFVVLDGIAEPAILAAPGAELLRAAYDAISDRPPQG